MVKTRYWLAFAFAFAPFGLYACGEETASVGDLRCMGESTHCDQSRFGFSETVPTDYYDFDAIDAGAPEVLPEGTVEVIWTEKLSCASETCDNVQVVVEDDGSLTVAADVYDVNVPNGPTVRGTWIARYGTDGTMLAENTDLVDRDLDPAAEPTATLFNTLAATARGTLLVGSIGQEPDIFVVDDDGKPTPLWKSGRGVVDSIASVGKDLLVAGTFWVEPHLHSDQEVGSSTGFPEVARYDRDGALVWRQTALQAPDPEDSHADSNLPMVVDKDGRSFVVALDYGWSGPAQYWRRLIALTPDGNVSYASPTFLDETSGDAHLGLTSKGDVVVAHGAYTLDVYHRPVGKPSKTPGVRSVSRYREQFWDLSVLAFVVDSDDRLLVATNDGDRAARRVIIDRYSSDLAERQTFAFSDPDALGDVPVTGKEGYLTGSTILGMRVGLEGELYVLTQTRILRIELP